MALAAAIRIDHQIVKIPELYHSAIKVCYFGIYRLLDLKFDSCIFYIVLLLKNILFFRRDLKVTPTM